MPASDHLTPIEPEFSGGGKTRTSPWLGSETIIFSLADWQGVSLERNSVKVKEVPKEVLYEEQVLSLFMQWQAGLNNDSWILFGTCCNTNVSKPKMMMANQILGESILYMGPHGIVFLWMVCDLEKKDLMLSNFSSFLSYYSFCTALI